MYYVSICIPVFGTEKYLEECLISIANQDYRDYEVIVVNDGSNGRDEIGRNCRKIIKGFEKEYRIDVEYYEFGSNKGLVEARRKAIELSSGRYILILDSDDRLPEGALSSLVSKAEETKADIIQGKTTFTYDPSDSSERALFISEKKIEVMNSKVNEIHATPIEGRDIFRGYLLEHNQSGFLWAKLIRRELYIKALSMIGPIYSVFAEDFLQYFWISYFADSYVLSDEIVYDYRIDSGISSNQKITDLGKWEKVCSTSSVFTSIYDSLAERKIELREDEAMKLEEDAIRYLGNNIVQLERTVVEELKEEAYELLKDYWGNSFVADVRKELVNQGILEE